MLVNIMPKTYNIIIMQSDFCLKLFNIEPNDCQFLFLIEKFILKYVFPKKIRCMIMYILIFNVKIL